MSTELVEIRVSEIKPGDLWLLEGGWVVVNAVEVGHPDDRVGIDYINDGTETEFTNPWGFEVAVVKREVAVSTCRDRGVLLLDFLIESALSVDDMPIGLPSRVECEMLAGAGVEVRDLDVAVETWVTAKNMRRAGTPWGYIRTVAWNEARRRLAAQSGVLHEGSR